MSEPGAPPTEPREAPQPAPDDRQQPPPAARTVDLLTIGLLVFFVSLLLTVAALLALPVIFG